MPETRTAIVTGAARGIGAGVATRLADDGFQLMVDRARRHRDDFAPTPAGEAALHEVVTKLDGSGKGGVVIAIQNELGIPTRFIGTGEKLEDFAEFYSRAFVEQML